MGNVLVYAETKNGQLPKSTLIAIEAGKTAASKLGGDLLIAILGSGTDTGDAYPVFKLGDIAW